jgi:uncharacterized coiled-coil protein SlyX
MRNAKLAVIIGGALVLGLGLGAASPPLHDATMPAVGADHVAVDQLKMLTERVKRLETADAAKNAEIETLKTQIASQAQQISTLTAALSTVQSQMGDYVPVSGPGNCTSHGYTTAGSAGELVYTWGGCKAP